MTAPFAIRGAPRFHRIQMSMRRRRSMIGMEVAFLVGVLVTLSSCQQRVSAVEQGALREYGGTYQWGQDAFLYLQLWSELSGENQLVAFDESGEVRTLYPTNRDRFFTGPGAALPTAVASRVEFRRDSVGRITSLTWQRDSAPPRVARRVEIEHHDDVQLSNGEVRLAGTLVSPNTPG